MNDETNEVLAKLAAELDHLKQQRTGIDAAIVRAEARIEGAREVLGLPRLKTRRGRPPESEGTK